MTIVHTTRMRVSRIRDNRPLSVKTHSSVAPALNSKLLAYFEDVQKNVYLQLELAAIVDWCEHFVKATYLLEGDGPIVL